MKTFSKGQAERRNRTKEAVKMKEVRNSSGKLICRLDEKKTIVEIVYRGCKTQIHFKPNGTVEIINTKTTAQYVN